MIYELIFVFLILILVLQKFQIYCRFDEMKDICIFLSVANMLHNMVIHH